MTALPKGEGIVYWHKKWSVSVSIRSIHCLQLPLNARAARKSDGRKTVSVPLLSLWEVAGAPTSIGKCWHLRRQMTSLNQSPAVTAPKGRPRHRILAQEMERICIDTLHSPLRLPLNARAARKSDGRKTVSVPAPLASPCGRGGRAARTERQITATSIGKCWHLRRQMTSRGRKALSVTCGDSSPKGEPRHHILAQEMERICIDTLHSLFYGYPSMRVPPESRMVVKRFPSRHPLPLPVGEVASAARTEKGK